MFNLHYHQHHHKIFLLMLSWFENTTRKAEGRMLNAEVWLRDRIPGYEWKLLIKSSTWTRKVSHIHALKFTGNGLDFFQVSYESRRLQRVYTPDGHSTSVLRASYERKKRKIRRKNRRKAYIKSNKYIPKEKVTGYATVLTHNLSIRADKRRGPWKFNGK